MRRGAVQSSPVADGIRRVVPIRGAADVRRIFISVAEQSADEHAAGVVLEFHRRFPETEFVGLAGPRMRAAGCRCIEDLTTRASMLTGVVERLPAALATVSRVDRFLARNRLDAAVLVDSGTLHLPLARRCKARGLPVLYFIAPQTWASRPWRNRAIRERVDRLAAILPFEEAYFRQRGIPATYVGHPLFDRLANEPRDEARIGRLRGEAMPVVTLLPGSRRKVVREVLPGQIDVVREVSRRFRSARFLLAAANPGAAAVAREVISGRPDAPEIQIEEDYRSDVIRAADLVLVASGTATLEVAYHHTPMIVMYNARLARWAYPLLRGWMIQTEVFSLPNILAGRRIVPEFMPYCVNTSEIAMSALELLSSSSLRERMREELAELMQPIVRTGACASAAEQLAALLGEQRLGGTEDGSIGSRHRVW